jgi:hypothetical protein
MQFVSDANMITVEDILLVSIVSGKCPVSFLKAIVKLA